MYFIENDVLFVNDTGILGKRNSEFSQQESNLRLRCNYSSKQYPQDYHFRYYCHRLIVLIFFCQFSTSLSIYVGIDCLICHLKFDLFLSQQRTASEMSKPTSSKSKCTKSFVVCFFPLPFHFIPAFYSFIPLFFFSFI